MVQNNGKLLFNLESSTANYLWYNVENQIKKLYGRSTKNTTIYNIITLHLCQIMLMILLENVGWPQQSFPLQSFHYHSDHYLIRYFHFDLTLMEHL